MADELSRRKRNTVIAWLRDLADRIENGEIEADAAAAVLSEGDIHRPVSIGYEGRSDVWVHARQSFYEGPYGRSPEERAEWRAEQEQQRQATQDIYDRAHPWRCNCHQRFKTHRGWKTHRGAHRRRVARYDSTIVYGGSGSPDHETVVEVDVADPEPPIQLFPQSS